MGREAKRPLKDKMRNTKVCTEVADSVFQHIRSLITPQGERAQRTTASLHERVKILWHIVLIWLLICSSCDLSGRLANECTGQEIIPTNRAKHSDPVLARGIEQDELLFTDFSRSDCSKLSRSRPVPTWPVIVLGNR